MDQPNNPARYREGSGLSSLSLAPELLAVIALLVLAGGILAIGSLINLPDVVSVLDEGELGRAFGSLGLALLLVVGFIGISFLVLARQIYEGERVGRILTVVVAAAVVLGWATAETKSTSDTISALCSVAVIAVLTLSTAARAHFTGASSAEGEQPAPVVAARSLVVALAWLFGVVGLAFLPFGSFDGTYFAAGLGIIGVSFFAYSLSKKLGEGNPRARVGVSILMSLYLVLTALPGELGGDLFIPIGLGVAVIGLLWVPEEIQAFFGGAPFMSSIISEAAAGRGEQATRECPHCGESMGRDKAVCSHCERESTPWQLHRGYWWHTSSTGRQYWLNEKNNEWVEWAPEPTRGSEL